MTYQEWSELESTVALLIRENLREYPPEYIAKLIVESLSREYVVQSKVTDD